MATFENSSCRIQCSNKSIHLGRQLKVESPASSRDQSRTSHTALSKQGLDKGHAKAHAWTKRGALFGFLSVVPVLLRPPKLGAAILKSLKSERPSTLTFLNQSDRAIKVYWNNYDADREFFARIPPAGKYTIDTWASHPWSVVDAETGALVKEVVAVEGSQVIPISGPEDGSLRPELHSKAETNTSSAFDGLDGAVENYAPAQIAEVRFDSNGAVIALKADGFEELLAIAIGPAEAFNLYRTFGPETRRPSTLLTWKHSLEAVGVNLERIVLTRLVGSTYYSRLILKQDGRLRSVDSRPSDSLALALQSRTPIFASKELMRVNEEEGAMLKKLQDGVGPEVLIPEERGGKGLPGPDLPVDPGYGGAFSA